MLSTCTRRGNHSVSNAQHNDDHWIGIAKRKGLREFRCKHRLKLRQIHTRWTQYIAMSKGQNVQLKLVNGSFSPSEFFERDALVNGFASSLNHGWEEFQTSRWMIEIRIHTCKSFFSSPQYAVDCSYFRRRKTVIPIRYTILQNNTKLSLFFSFRTSDEIDFPTSQSFHSLVKNFWKRFQFVFIGELFELFKVN